MQIINQIASVFRSFSPAKPAKPTKAEKFNSVLKVDFL